MSLITASTLLLVLRHFCYVSMHVSDQCFNIPSSATTLMARGDRRLRDCVFVYLQIEVQSAYSVQVYACQVIKCT